MRVRSLVFVSLASALPFAVFSDPLTTRPSPERPVILQQGQCVGPPTSGERRVSGTITWGDGTRLGGARVRAWDDDFGDNDFMQEAITNACGEYTIAYAGGHWDPSPSHRITIWRPDIYVTVELQVGGRWLRAGQSNTTEDHRLREHLTKNVSVRPLPRIFGVVRSEVDNNASVPGVTVKAWDSDITFDEEMGETFTDDSGKYEILYERKDWDWVQEWPDIYAWAFRDGRRAAQSEYESGWDPDEPLELNITIPKPKPMVAPAPQQTCSAKAPTASFKQFSFVAQERQYGCLAKSVNQVSVFRVWANDRDEAQECVLRSVGDPDGDFIDLHDESAVRLRFYTILDYNTCPFGSSTVGPWCHQRIEPTVSSGAGYTCVASEWRLSDHDIRIYDYTQQVSLPNGGINYTAWNATCPTKCLP